jgi:hypothetical protein
MISAQESASSLTSVSTQQWLEHKFQQQTNERCINPMISKNPFRSSSSIFANMIATSIDVPITRISHKRSLSTTGLSEYFADSSATHHPTKRRRCSESGGPRGIVTSTSYASAKDTSVFCRPGSLSAFLEQPNDSLKSVSDSLQTKCFAYRRLCIVAVHVYY